MRYGAEEGKNTDITPTTHTANIQKCFDGCSPEYTCSEYRRTMRRFLFQRAQRDAGGGQSQLVHGDTPTASKRSAACIQYNAESQANKQHVM